jgi:tetratricopeptide (TPR) repeat protein
VLDGPDVQALDPTEVLRLRARIHITRAVTRFGIDGPEAGLGVLDEVHRMVQGQAAALLGVQAHLQAGAINVMASNWRQALAELEQVEPHLDELVVPERCAALINRGLAHLSLFHLDLGRADLEAAAALAVAHSLPLEEFKARHNLGCLAYLAGDIPGALRLLGEAAGMDVDITSARGHLDHGKVLLDAGLVDEAEEVLQRGLDAARHDHQPFERGEIHLDLARAALLRGDAAEARTRAGHAVRTFRAIRAAGRAEEVELLGAVIDLGVGRRLTRAAQVASRWDTPTPTLPSERLATRIKVEVALARQDLDAARAELSRLGSGHPVSLGVLLHEHLLAARLAEAEGDHPRATGIMREAAARLAHDQGEVHSLEVRAGLAFHAARIRDADVAAATDTGSLAELFESVERWRAASHRTPPLRPSDDEETAALVGRLRQLRQVTPHGSSAHLDEDATALEAAITTRLRAVRGDPDGDDLQPASADVALRTAADRGVTLVTFHEVRGTVVRLVLDGSRILQSVLGAAGDLATAAARAHADVRAASLARPSMAAFLDRARERSLLEVDRALLGGVHVEGTVVVVPTTALASLPWRALPSLSPHPVVAAPSVTAWVRRPTRATGPPGVAALAGPGLPRALEEVGGIVKAWGRHTGSRGRTPHTGYAVASDVRDALAASSVVHLAAHGHHVDQSPLFSSLDMADGPVFAHELRAPLAAELVVLSACDVGRTRGRAGDEPLGLAAALLSLGVQCVVAATNPVRDDVAAAAMVELHQRLAAGADVATALRDTTARVPGAEAFCAYGNTWQAD